MREGNLTGGTLSVGRAIIPMWLPAFETAAVYLDIRCVAQAVSTSEERIIA